MLTQCYLIVYCYVRVYSAHSADGDSHQCLFPLAGASYSYLTGKLVEYSVLLPSTDSGRVQRQSHFCHSGVVISAVSLGSSDANGTSTALTSDVLPSRAVLSPGMVFCDATGVLIAVDSDSTVSSDKVCSNETSGEYIKNSVIVDVDPLGENGEFFTFVTFI